MSASRSYVVGFLRSGGILLVERRGLEVTPVWLGGRRYPLRHWVQIWLTDAMDRYGNQSARARSAVNSAFHIE